MEDIVCKTTNSHPKVILSWMVTLLYSASNMQFMSAIMASLQEERSWLKMNNRFVGWSGQLFARYQQKIARVQHKPSTVQ